MHEVHHPLKMACLPISPPGQYQKTGFSTFGNLSQCLLQTLTAFLQSSQHPDLHEFFKKKFSSIMDNFTTWARRRKCKDFLQLRIQAKCNFKRHCTYFTWVLVGRVVASGKIVNHESKPTTQLPCHLSITFVCSEFCRRKH